MPRTEVTHELLGICTEFVHEFISEYSKYEYIYMNLFTNINNMAIRATELQIWQSG